MGLEAGLGRFWQAAGSRGLGVDVIRVVVDDGPQGERRRIDDIRRDVFSVSKTVTSLAIGFSLGAIGLQLRTSEIIRLAQLLLHGGLDERRRLVPAGYIARMTTDTTDTGRVEPDNRTYGLGVWLCARDRAWRLDGIYGQFGIVLPGPHACVGIMAHYQGPTTRILDCAWEHLVPELA